MTPVPERHLLLVSRDLVSKSRLEALDLISGGASGKDFKGKPIVHVLQLSDGSELWYREFDVLGR